MRKINKIIVHCSATRPDWMAQNSPLEQLLEIRRWHVEDNGWSDIGYHAYIARTGEVIQGRPIEIQGAHTRGHNSDSIGVCLAGGFGSSSDDRAVDHYTPAQLASLWQFIKDARNTYGNHISVSGHNEYANKGCPGFPVARWLAAQSILEAQSQPIPRTSPTQSNTIRASGVSIAASLGSAGAMLSSLGDIAQYIVLGFAGVSILLGIFIMRERLRSWARGWQ
jgi:N-acetylmuramoyl-L-alanine amidase